MTINKKNKILILEDGELQSQLYIHSLREIGYHAVIIENATTIVDAIAEHEPALLIVSDSQLNTDPLSHINHIRSVITDIPIIIGLFNTDNASILDAFNVGATDYIKLPINWRMLSHKISRCIDGYDMKSFYGHKIKYTLHETIKSKLITDSDYVISLFSINDNNVRIVDSGRVFSLRDSFREQIKEPGTLDTSQEFFLQINKGSFSSDKANSEYMQLSNYLSVFKDYTINFCAFYFSKDSDREVDLKMFIEEAVNRITRQEETGNFAYLNDNDVLNLSNVNFRA